MPLTRAPVLLAVALGLTAAVDSRADDKETCVKAVEHAQLARLDGKLSEAREGFVTCARPVCPTAIREDCTRWVAEVDASLPSVVFEAVWADGQDVTGMTVLIDGKLRAGAERGRAVSLDPGEHTFHFEVPGAAPIETRNVIREGEKNRILHVSFPGNAPTAPAPTPAPVAAPVPPPTVAAPPDLWQQPPAPEAAPSTTRRGPIPIAAWVLGGVGLVGGAGFAYFGLSGMGQLDSMRSSCGRTCNPSDVNSARNEILVGDILGTVGLAAAGVAIWLALTRPDLVASAATR